MDWTPNAPVLDTGRVGRTKRSPKHSTPKSPRSRTRPRTAAHLVCPLVVSDRHRSHVALGRSDGVGGRSDNVRQRYRDLYLIDIGARDRQRTTAVTPLDAGDRGPWNASDRGTHRAYRRRRRWERVVVTGAGTGASGAEAECEDGETHWHGLPHCLAGNALVADRGMIRKRCHDHRVLHQVIALDRVEEVEIGVAALGRQVILKELETGKTHFVE